MFSTVSNAGNLRKEMEERWGYRNNKTSKELQSNRPWSETNGNNKTNTKGGNWNTGYHIKHNKQYMYHS